MAAGPRGYLIVQPRGWTEDWCWLLVTHMFSDGWPFVQVLLAHCLSAGAAPIKLTTFEFSRLRNFTPFGLDFFFVCLVWRSAFGP